MSGIRAVLKTLVASTLAVALCAVVIGCDGGSSAPAGNGTAGGGQVKEVEGKTKDSTAKNVKGSVDFGAGIPAK